MMSFCGKIAALCFSPCVRPLPVSEGSNSHPAIKHRWILQNTVITIVLNTKHSFVFVTSHRKKSECFLSDALLTNSLNGSVLWINQCSWELVCAFLGVCVCVTAHLYTKFLRRKSICGTVDTWIFTSLSDPFCLRYSTVHFSRHGPRSTPLSRAGLRWGESDLWGVTLNHEWPLIPQDSVGFYIIIIS